MACRLRYSVLAAALGLLGSCSPYQRLYTDFMKGRSSIRYIHTSKKEFKKTDNRVNVSLPVITDSRFKSAGNVRHVKSTVIPLIVFNSWDYRYECEVGQPLIIENLPRFIQASVIAESRRSGTFGIDSVSNDSGL